MKKSIIIALIILVVVLILISVLFISTSTHGQTCKLKGGRIVNTLGGETCAEDETNTGVVKGYKCPCICCVPSK